jgi:tricorn protease
MKRWGAALLLIATVPSLVAAAEKPVLMRHPTINHASVVFSYGGDLWKVPITGGDAVRLTSGAGVAGSPMFSPDGSRIAFTGEFDGNRDVYVVLSSGGIPHRLTYHPGADDVVGWTPDGRQILFRSARNSYSRFTRLFTIPLEGGLPTELPLATAYEGSYSPDGMHIAYVPLPPAFWTWKHYRGGRASSVLVADLADSRVEKLPRTDSNDFNPMWLGDRVYFLSDRNGPISLYSYDPSTKQVQMLIDNQGRDIKSASAGPDRIVYEQFGSLHIFDPRTNTSTPLEVRIAGDLAGVRPRFEKAAKEIQNADISPSGLRAVFEAHGEILTVPAEKGDIRNLTNSPGTAERSPAWSPDGRSIAYFSDASGEYRLYICDQQGGNVKKFDLGKSPSFYFNPIWSPDGKKIAYTDKRLNLWVLDLASAKNTLVDTDRFDDRTIDPVWSPDSRWIAYTKQLPSLLHAVLVYNLESGQIHQVTDGMSDARFPVFDRNGKYLYFASSTDVGAASGWGMSSIGRPVSRSIYAIVLREDLPSPLAPESDDEKGAEEGKSDESSKDAKDAKKSDKPKNAKAAEPVRIHFEDIAARTVALPIETKNYTWMAGGKAGILYLLETPAGTLSTDGPEAGPRNLHRFDLEKRKSDQILEGIFSPHIADKGEKLLYRRAPGQWFLASAAQPKPGDGALKLDAMEVRVVPRSQWKQMFHEVWRIERDFLYDPHAHGLDLAATEKEYAPYLDQVACRADLTYLFTEMLGNLTLGHVYVLGGDSPAEKKGAVGLLGADYNVENGRYRFARVYPGGSWDPHLHGPLNQPGTKVKAGEYLLAVAGRDLAPPDNLYARFQGTAQKSVVIRVGPNADGSGARDITVVPVADETTVRNQAWIDDNRRKVDELSGGRIAYVYVPDTALSGFTSFIRYFFPQAQKEGAIVDERFNSGGILADYIVDTLRKPLIGWCSTREGEDVTLPPGAVFGPKAMIINEMAGSGGDQLPHYFRQTKTGPLIGKRTWGGLVGINDYPPLLDGGIVTAPSAAFWFPSGKWEVENHGVDPDIEVEFDPQAVRAGHDPQLEKAVEVVLEQIKAHPQKRPPHPAYPDYQKQNGSAARR